MRTSPREHGAWRLEERRTEARYTLVLRAGLIEQAGKSSLCLVKNISTSGVQVKLYTQPVAGAEVTVRIADEPAVCGHITWINDKTAGISFHQDLDAATLLRVQQKLSSKRRRAMPRVQIDMVATLRTGGGTYRVIVSDISSLGARVRTRSQLFAGDRVTITLPGLPAIRGYVRWSDAHDCGLTFEAAIPMQLLANWVDVGSTRVP